MTNMYINTLTTAFNVNEETAQDLAKVANLTGFLNVITTQPINGKAATEVEDSLTTSYKVYGEIKQRFLRVSSFVKKFYQGTYIIVTGNDTSTVVDGTVVGGLASDKALVKKAYKVI